MTAEKAMVDEPELVIYAFFTVQTRTDQLYASASGYQKLLEANLSSFSCSGKQPYGKSVHQNSSFQSVITANTL